MTDKDFLNIRQEYSGEKAANIRTQLVLPNGKVMQNHFMSRFTDNEVNSDTATIAVYTEFNNDEGYLIPGNYVKMNDWNQRRCYRFVGAASCCGSR